MDDRERRAAERRGRLVLRKTVLGDESDPWPVRGEQAVTLLTSLTRSSWELAGQPVEPQERALLPVRFVRRRA